MTETFGAWLETRRRPPRRSRIASRCAPEPVRYRIRRCERTLGDQFGDPDARFAMEMVLRVMRLREKKFQRGDRRATLRRYGRCPARPGRCPARPGGPQAVGTAYRGPFGWLNHERQAWRARHERAPYQWLR